MTDLTPESFRELLSAVCLALGITFSLLSLAASIRRHSLRLVGLFLLSSLALYANNAWCYFGAVFIAATAVTRLDFLQNLAAIIRGSKPYFDFQKEIMSEKEVKDSAAKDAEEVAAIGAIVEAEGEQSELASATVSNGRAPTALDKALQAMRHVSLIDEEYVFRFLERKYGRPIQRHIRFRRGDAFAEFDGIIETGSEDTVFELMMLGDNGRIRVYLLHSVLGRTLERVRAYRMLTFRRASLVIVVVGEMSESVRNGFQKICKEYQSKEQDLDLSLELYSESEVGISNQRESTPAEPSAGAGD